NISFTQQITGNLKYHANQEIKLMGYSGLETIELAKGTVDSLGNFVLPYNYYQGMGYLTTADESQLFLVINELDINIQGSHLQKPDSISFNNSFENQIFT